jgi:hypothetical protein
VRAVALLHPAWRIAAMAATSALLVARSGLGDDICFAFRVGSLLVCAAVVEFGVAVAIAVGAAALLTLRYMRDYREETTDDGLTELDLAAAASASAYAPLGRRVSELYKRGVESANWVEDGDISTDVVAVLHNRFTQTCLIAFRGSFTRGDWSSNLKHVLPGNEENSRSFRQALEVARSAQLKYAFSRKIRLTGHSRGGTMADFCGRRLGLPSLQINPGMGIKLFRSKEDPAVSSLTARSLDLISLMEVVHARDRQVVFRWPAKAFEKLAVHLLILLISATLIVLAGSSWVRTSGTIGCVAAVTAYVLWMHSIQRFTLR